MTDNNNKTENRPLSRRFRIAGVLAALLCAILLFFLIRPAFVENSAGAEATPAAAEAEAPEETAAEDEAAAPEVTAPEDEAREEPETGKARTETGLAASLSNNAPVGPLEISEVTVSNSTTAPLYDGTCCDWVEIRNISDSSVLLADYCLSDKQNKLTLWAFPAVSLEPGAYILVYCDGDADTVDSVPHTSFSLDCSAEDLFLTDADGNILDAVFLHDVPVDGSMGRVDGEDGWFYFTEPTPYMANTGTAYPAVSVSPEASVAGGTYNDIESLTVELSGAGPVYYTLDGSVPTSSSALYEEPLTLTETTVVRAICVEEGNAPSRVATFSYIINENHVLPVLSLAVDDPEMFNYAYAYADTNKTLAASLSLYDDSGEVFNSVCGVAVKGKTSLNMPKKSLGVVFNGIYGAGELNCDVFGTGVDEYNSLNIRAGQDYTFAVIRNELVQALADEAGGNVLTQASRYCILYVNGEYYGLFCLKDDYSRSLYAEQNDVSKSDVSYLWGPAPSTSAIFTNLYLPCESQDMSDPDNYHAAISTVNLDSFIDWILIEGWCCNTDTQGNVKFFTTSEACDDYEFALYDLDWAFYYPNYNFINLFYTENNGNGAYYMARIILSMVKNDEFRAALLSRAAELFSTTLSNEHVLARIDEMAAGIEPEMARNQERWELSMDKWTNEVDKLKAYITDNNLARLSIDNLCRLMAVSDEERALYFGAEAETDETGSAESAEPEGDAEPAAESAPSAAP